MISISKLNKKKINDIGCTPLFELSWNNPHVSTRAGKKVPFLGHKPTISHKVGLKFQLFRMYFFVWKSRISLQVRKFHRKDLSKYNFFQAWKYTAKLSWEDSSTRLLCGYFKLNYVYRLIGGTPKELLCRSTSRIPPNLLHSYSYSHLPHSSMRNWPSKATHDNPAVNHIQSFPLNSNENKTTIMGGGISHKQMWFC